MEKNNTAFSKGESSIDELFESARKYNDDVIKIVTRTKIPAALPIDKLRQQISGYLLKSLPLPKKNIPLVVTLKTAEHKMPPLYFSAPYIKIVWEDCGTPERERLPKADILKEETELATRLKRCCDPFGREKDNRLNESASILLDMSRLYLNRAMLNQKLREQTFVKNSGITLEVERLTQVNSTGRGDSTRPAETNYGMEQKLCFIKAAGLAVAAKIRFKKVRNKDGKKRAEVCFSRILQELLIAATASGSGDTNFLGLLTSLEVKLMAYREMEGDELEEVVVIQEQDIGEHLLKKEIRKIEQIRKLCHKNTTNFITIMSKISKQCQKILGKPPCLFAIIGLGSLARKEVTLYSDFEHAIALENGAEERPEWSSIQEYFRWFTALFHTIVIGFGETVIPSLDIKSLYEEDGSKCWFSDEITPNGVSFDGMMPHACKIPLGRTEKTKYKEHTVELIQTAKNMAQFLTRSEDVKNGYFLKEVLSRTCFVCGNKEVYDSYLEESRDVLIREGFEPFAIRVAKYILLNPTDTIRGTHIDFFAQQKSIKVMTYRPMTTLLAYIGVLCGINHQSSFEILDEMKSREILDDIGYHILTYALAVAIEGGLKAYHAVGHQRKMVVAASWATLVEKKSWIDCQVVLELLRSITRELPPTQCLKISLCSRTNDLWKALACTHLPTLVMFKEGAKTSLKLLCSTIDKFNRDEIFKPAAEMRLKILFGNLRHCFLRLHLQRFEENLTLAVLPFRQDLPKSETRNLMRCEWACEKMLQCVSIPEVDVAAYQSLCVIRFSQKRYHEGLAYFEQWHQMFEGSSHEMNFLDMWMYEMIMRTEVMGDENVLVYITTMLSGNIPFERRCVLEMTRAQVWFKIGRKKSAREELLRVTLIIKANVDKLNKYAYEYLLRRLREVQSDNKLFNQVSITTKLLSDVVAENFTQDMRLLPDQLRDKEREIEIFYSKKHDPQSLMRDLQQKTDDANQTMRGQLLAMLRSHELSICFSYKEMMDMAGVTIAQCKPMILDRGYFLAYVFSLMALFENVRVHDVANAVKMYHEAPSKVKVFRALQPFIYGFLKTTSSNSCTLGMRKHQEKVLSAVFGHEGSEHQWKIYRSAIYYFGTLRLRECVALLWKVLYSVIEYESIKKASTELLATATVTFLVLQKRRNPAKYFSKTREISRKQLQWVTAAVTGRTDSFAERNFSRSKLYIYTDLPLVPVYNLAMECNDTNVKKLCLLHWKILHNPSDSPRVKHASLLSLSDAVCFTVSPPHSARDV